MSQISWAPADARKHVRRLGGTLHLYWMAATLHVAAFRVGRGSSYLASHKERSSAQVDLSVPLVLGSGLWPGLRNNTLFFNDRRLRFQTNSIRRCHLIKSCSLLGAKNNKP